MSVVMADRVAVADTAPHVRQTLGSMGHHRLLVDWDSRREVATTLRVRARREIEEVRKKEK